MLDEARAYWRLVSGLKPFLGNPLSTADAVERYRRQFDRREQDFLSFLTRAVYGSTGSPYRTLLEWAGASVEDVAALVRRRGVEASLEALFAAGVYVSLEEFKGRRPIERGGRSISVTPASFDNPLTHATFVGRTSGSCGPARRLAFDFDQLDDDVPCHALFLEAFGIQDYDLALWRPVPPGVAGIRRALIHGRLGGRVTAWFSQNPTGWPGSPLRSTAITWSVAAGGRCWSRGFAFPRHVPLADASRIVGWIARAVGGGRKVHLSTSVSAGVRVASAAKAAGVDLGAVFFCVGGEPLTRRRAAVFEEAGARVSSLYSMTECGQIGSGCADAAEPDDVHLMRSKIAAIQRERPGGLAGSPIPGALFLTTLRPSTAKVMLNAESGDTGVIERRRCGCPTGALGLDDHLHSIRSYEKLTSEGMSILADDVLHLVEAVLPGRFGGTATDYQFVEDRGRPLPSLAIAVSPRLGTVDESAVVRVTLDYLGSRSPGDRMMADYWRQAGTVQVVRREPAATHSAKIPALVVEQQE